MHGDDTFTLDAVFIRRQRFWGNGFRVVPKWNPGAVDLNGEPVRNAGKASKGAHWREEALQNPPRWARQRPDSDALGTGFLTGELVAIDADVDDQELCDRIVALVEQRAGGSRLVRQGRAPKLAMCYRTTKGFRRMATAEMKIGSGGPVERGPLGPGERKVMVEVLGAGQSLTADAIHPETGEPYRWLDLHPLDVPLADLLLIDEATAREFIEEAEQILREAGAVDIKLPREEKQRRERKSNGSDFFQRVNDWALRNPDCWVKQIFPQAKRQGNGAWRIPAPLRGLPASKQDISIHDSGIRDFHEDRSLSPIDFVIEFGQGVYRGAAREAGCVRVRPESEDLFDAAFWLVRQLGISPADLGWGDSHGGPPPYTEIPEHCQAEPAGEAGPPSGPPEPPPANAPEGPGGSLPTILVTGGHRHVAADKALDALKEARLPVFVQDVGLVTVITKPKKLPDDEIVRVPCLHPMGLARLGRLCGQTARWHRYNDKGRLQRIDPPRPVLEQMLEMQSQWRFPPITGICDTPTLRRDFSLLQTEGYDAATGLWCDFGGLRLPHIPTRPTRRQAEAGLKLLLDILSTFPWDGEISRSVAVAGYITPVVRACFDVVPMTLLTARTFGTGKTYYVQVGGAIWTGQKVPPIAMGPKDDEFEKRLVMAALEGRSYIFVDNVSRLIEGDLLCQLGEQSTVYLRPLGTSAGRVVHNTYSVFLTGNNAAVAADLARRTLRAGLDANMEAPELRTHSDPQLFEHVRDRRGECVAAVLTAVLYYVNAGRPNCLPQIASYGRWSDTVRSLLVHLGLADPCDSMTELRKTDPRRVQLASLFEDWLDAMQQNLIMRDSNQRGLLSSELISFAEAYPELKAELLEVADRKATGKVNSAELGKKLAGWEGRIALDHKLVCDRERNTQKPRWRLVPVAEIGETGGER